MVTCSGTKGRWSRAPKAGFTLLELLVVIAIIALLIAILLPSLEAARRQAKKAACLSNLKSIASSSRVYEADDPQGWGIPVHPLQYQQDPDNPTYVGAYEWGGKSGIGQDDFFDGNPGKPLNSKYGTKVGFGPATRPMNEIIFGTPFTDFNKPTFNRFGAEQDYQLELDVFHCPGDNGPPRGGHCADWVNKSERSSYDHFGNSYAANIFMTANSGGGEMCSNSPYLRPITRVPTPARTLYYEENIGRWAWAAREDVCTFLDGINVGPTNQLDGWHGQIWSYNRVFADSHGEYQKIYVEGSENSQGFAEHYRPEQLESYPPFCDGSPGSFQTYECIIVRGNGWQKDTLPATPLSTGLDWPGSGQLRPSYEDCVEP